VSNELITIPASQLTPMVLIEKAMQSDTSIERMEQLFNLQLRWEENEAKKAYHQAVADFKAESITILKDKKVSFQSQGGLTEYNHATLGNIIQTIIPVMSKYNLSHSWDISQDGQSISVTCHLTHSMGHSRHVSMCAGKDDSGKKNAIQQVASTVTYLERYTLLAITGQAAQDQDDDSKTSQAPIVEVITEQQAGDLQALIAEVKADEKKFCVFYKIDSVENLPLEKFESAVKSLESNRRK
jgi:ERF superfamily